MVVDEYMPAAYWVPGGDGDRNVSLQPRFRSPRRRQSKSSHLVRSRVAGLRSALPYRSQPTLRGKWTDHMAPNA
jgi:hypothetical protein